ncbi:FAD dependent oxidoreductase [Penicillium brasilianum]|uniref:FAD dependent oxidoreductase n=1 Tax=Penicillium brasilianum TaxID=104259 RepID=A0A1S9RHG3_PENBI|nr:FAD dependent oxidoreductase [Penicillium brasilianum]
MASNHVAIIGAGLSGLTLALSLHKQSIPSTIYEARSASLDIGGAIMLSPNALRILDALDIYQKIKPRGFEFTNLHFYTDKPLDTYEFGDREKYQYDALRIYRHELIDVLLTAVKEKGISIEYGKKFTRILTESETEVTWEFEDGQIGRAACLVGADGIHSRVRKYLYPDLEPQFTNAVGVTAAIPTSQLTGTDAYQMPVTIMNPKHGAFVIAKQLPDGSEVLIGKQKRAAQLDREGWSKLLNDKQWCVDFLREGAESFPEIVQSSVISIPLDKINLWPFYVVPKLDTWASKHSRVVILGDAAHAIPPTAGQGINQAFEDVYIYSLILAKCQQHNLEQGLKVWQKGRQERVDRVLDLNAQIDARRMPKNSQSGPLDLDTKTFDLAWLYSPNFDEMAESWLAAVGIV